MDIPLELSLEQQFNLKAYEAELKQMDPMQTQKMLLEVLQQLMVKDNVIRHLLKQSTSF